MIYDRNQTPANDDAKLFLTAGSALDELYRRRLMVLGRDTASHTLDDWRLRREALEELECGIRLCLRRLGSPT